MGILLRGDGIRYIVLPCLLAEVAPAIFRDDISDYERAVCVFAVIQYRLGTTIDVFDAEKRCRRL